MALGGGRIGTGAKHRPKLPGRAERGLRPRSRLRDSQLLTSSVQLGYVSRQLGHSDVSITARHYARWAGGDAYRSPLEVVEDPRCRRTCCHDSPKSRHTIPTAPRAPRQGAPRNPRASRALGGDPGRIRICDLRLRRPTLYPAELLGHDLVRARSCCFRFLCCGQCDRSRRDWWDVEDLNLRPPRCEHGALAS